MFRGPLQLPFERPPISRTRAGSAGPLASRWIRTATLWVADSGNGRVLRFPSPLCAWRLTAGGRPGAGSNRLQCQNYGPHRPHHVLALRVGVRRRPRCCWFPMPRTTVCCSSQRRDGAFASGTAATQVFGQSGFNSSDQSSTGSPEDNRMRAPASYLDRHGRAVCTLPTPAITGYLIFDQVAFAPATDGSRRGGPGRGFRVRVESTSAPRPENIWVTDTGNNRAPALSPL